MVQDYKTHETLSIKVAMASLYKAKDWTKIQNRKTFLMIFATRSDDPNLTSSR